MSMDLIQVLFVIGTLNIATAQIIIEYDPEYHNPVGRIIQECPDGFFKAGWANQCFKYFNDIDRNFDEAKAKCEDENLRLAEPRDPITLRSYIIENIGNRWIYLGARGDGSSIVWLNGKNVEKLSGSRYWRPKEPGKKVKFVNCLFLMSHKDENKYSKTPYYSSRCDQKRPMLCEYVDECKIKNGNCEHVCNSIRGILSCSCRRGYKLKSDGKSCEEAYDKNAVRLVSIIREITVELKTSVELSCGYSPADIYIRRCVWSRPNRYNDIQIEDVYNKRQSGFSPVANSTLNQCGIVLNYIKERDIGKWTCKIFIPGKTLKGITKLKLDDMKIRDYKSYSQFYYTNEQCQEIATYFKRPAKWCKKKCDKTANCTALNYFNVYSQYGVKCSLHSCGRNPPKPIGKSIGVQGLSIRKVKNDSESKNAPNLVFNEKKMKVNLKTSVELNCGYSPAEFEIKGCSWHTAGNIEIEVQDIYKNMHPGLRQPTNSSLNQCGIILVFVRIVDIGKWTCKISVPGKTLRGTKELRLFNKGIRYYHKYSGLYFSKKQCPTLFEYKKSLDWCQRKCDRTTNCSAFNFITGGGKQLEKCSLKNCGKTPPYPIGKRTKWTGYSKKKIAKDYTHYHGPYSQIWTEEQQCGYIRPTSYASDPTFSFGTYVTCEQLCDRDPECTGFNFDLKEFDCVFFHCDPLTLAPEKKLDGWESWSKRKIIEYVSVYHEYDLHWTDKQCRNIGVHKWKSRRECEDICNTQTGCTAFNWKDKRGCELRKCSTTPPYPIGVSKGWLGYSTYLITTAGRYYGPYGKYWEDTQCDGIRRHHFKTRVECEGICDSTVNCTVFNFNRDNGECDIRACVVLHEPSGLKTEWESFSKAKFEPKGEPLLKCPSYHCKEENVPKYLSTLSQGHKNTYCCDYSSPFYCGNQCECQSSIFCWYNCKKCRELKNNDPLTNYFKSQ